MSRTYHDEHSCLLEWHDLDRIDEGFICVVVGDYMWNGICGEPIEIGIYRGHRIFIIPREQNGDHLADDIGKLQEDQPLPAKFILEVSSYICSLYWRRFIFEILPRGRQGPIYSAPSISWLLVTWRRKDPGHQESWDWHSYPGILRIQHHRGRHASSTTLNKGLLSRFAMLSMTIHVYNRIRQRNPVGVIMSDVF